MQEAAEAATAVWAALLKKCLGAPRTPDGVVKGLLVEAQKVAQRTA